MENIKITTKIAKADVEIRPWITQRAAIRVKEAFTEGVKVGPGGNMEGWDMKCMTEAELRTMEEYIVSLNGVPAEGVRDFVLNLPAEDYDEIKVAIDSLKIDGAKKAETPAT